MLRIIAAAVSAAIGVAIGMNFAKSDGLLHAAMLRNPIAQALSDFVFAYVPKSGANIYAMIYRNCTFFPYAALTGLVIGFTFPRYVRSCAFLWIFYVLVCTYRLIAMTIEIDLLFWHSMLDVHACLIALIPLYFLSAQIGFGIRNWELPCMSLIFILFLTAEIALIAAGGVTNKDWLIGTGILLVTTSLAIASIWKPDEPRHERRVAERVKL